MTARKNVYLGAGKIPTISLYGLYDTPFLIISYYLTSAVCAFCPVFLATCAVQRHRKPTSSETKAQSAVMLTFVLSLSVGIAISVLLGWHLYLIFTAQTTIEFYQNQTNRSRARQWGEVSEQPKDRTYYL